MAGSASLRSNPANARKRVEASTESGSEASLLRAKDGSAFTRCEECNKDVPVVLISMHNCSLEAKIKMNLEAQIVEKPSEVKKAHKRKKPTGTETEVKRTRKEKDANKLKRPPTAFFIFLDEFRKAYKEANPDSKDVKMVAKEAGEKWKSMTDEEKKIYQDKAADLKTGYNKVLQAENVDENVEVEGGSEKGASDKEVEELSDGE